ncbi:MAG: GntR family transcriptional regulator [Aestuariivita sp.]|nr:GntR family transcriptional regulator [Aestuariivita sp.]
MSNIPKSRGENAYDALIEALREGVFLPGDRLREEAVARKLQLSRTPVREALRRLESDGIVEHRARIGATIKVLSSSEIVELYEMRMVLERTAAEMAARHGNVTEFEALDAVNSEIKKNREIPNVCVSLNQDFHRSLYRVGRNRFLIEAARALNNSLLLLGPTTYTDTDRIDTVVSQHQDIIVALNERNESAAGMAAESHLRTSLLYRLKRGDP